MGVRRTILTLLLAGALVAPAAAQDVKIEARPPQADRERGIVVPGPRVEPTRPPDIDYYPHGTAVRHDPAFFEALSTETDTGRAGISGWTAPNQPVGAEVSGFREVSGWFALGVSVTWGAPPKPAAVRRNR
jgi:hypothetical protein